MHAKPNLNGNTPADFKRHGQAILAATKALETALNDAGECLHGRNYQTVQSVDWRDKAAEDAAAYRLLFQGLDRGPKAFALALLRAGLRED